MSAVLKLINCSHIRTRLQNFHWEWWKDHLGHFHQLSLKNLRRKLNSFPQVNLVKTLVKNKLNIDLGDSGLWYLSLNTALTHSHWSRHLIRQHHSKITKGKLLLTMVQLLPFRKDTKVRDRDAFLLCMCLVMFDNFRLILTALLGFCLCLNVLRANTIPGT